MIKDTSACGRKPLYDYIDKQRVVLRNLTELHFTPPDNTSFVEVQGPVRNDEYYWGVRDRNIRGILPLPQIFILGPARSHLWFTTLII